MIKLQGVIPAVRNMKDFDRILNSKQKYIILLETRLSLLRHAVKYAQKMDKQVLVHADLIQGLKSDEFGIEFLLRDIKVDGLISTRSNVISHAKKNKVTSIQRLFALDSQALEHNIKIINTLKPDYIEILPGVVPEILEEVYEKTGIPIIAGGLIRTKQDVENALNKGAKAITTSFVHLWEL
ncbi:MULTISPECIES: glycerol-3-phosphate responsive antiterminator [Heyndrickxia]|uniref:glycerol-3-phosphate responsive antiterminator n=1 Tax=Heyndrickxia TaxID=2837504 RepID=UPI000D33C547|nr:glycerol-3-phosphate responsive antiterminator [Heyndrickxia sporothermodurans]PTY77432.1 glycerol-3-phosphate responsive antiterminator GlpP [Heyndrickxia sporothermodurans]